MNTQYYESESDVGDHMHAGIRTCQTATGVGVTRSSSTSIMIMEEITIIVSIYFPIQPLLYFDVPANAK